MKKIRFIIVLLLVLASLTRCKIYEMETIEEIPCPRAGIDTLIISPWDPERGEPDNPSQGH